MKRQRILFAICGVVMTGFAVFGIAAGVSSYFYKQQLIMAGIQGSELMGPAVGYMLTAYYAPLAIPGIGAIVLAFKITKARLTVNTVFLVLLWALWFTTALWSMTVLVYTPLNAEYIFLDTISAFQISLIVIVPVLTYCVVSCRRKLKRSQQSGNAATLNESVTL
jgi:hypothetical protein